MKPFSKIKNPITDEYLVFKSIVLSNSFPWYFNPESNPNLQMEGFLSESFYSHTILQRPEDHPQKLCPIPISSIFNDFCVVIDQIFRFNGIEVNSLLRANLNCMYPDVLGNDKPTVPHYDHVFDYNHILIYLTDSGGNTIFLDDDIIEYEPNEDDIIIFPKCLHSNRLPQTKRRIVLVATYV
jgi:hypothetical protein